MNKEIRLAFLRADRDYYKALVDRIDPEKKYEEDTVNGLMARESDRLAKHAYRVYSEKVKELES